MISKYIAWLANHSKTLEHELIGDFLDKYNLYGLRDAKEWQLKEYITQQKKLIKDEEEDYRVCKRLQSLEALGCSPFSRGIERGA